MNVDGEPASPVTEQGDVFSEKSDHHLDEYMHGSRALLGHTFVDIQDLHEACNNFLGELSELEDDLSASESLFGQARFAHDDGPFEHEKLLRRGIIGRAMNL